MSKVILIGFMGSGKTTLGSDLARLMDLEFIDLDERIEIATGKKIDQIFREDGEEKFREIERIIFINLLEKDNFILATGGGTPCHFNNMQLMKSLGICIYLKASAQELFNWLIIKPGERPLIKGKNKTELKTWIETELYKREKFYQQANITVPAQSIKPNDLLLKIKKFNKSADKKIITDNP